jgi:hypothetical protein
MKNSVYIVEFNRAKKFQPSDTTPVAEVKTTSKSKAIEAYKFYLKSGVSPVDAEVTALDQANYDHNCAFTAYKKQTSL